jgi:hypothetical protein
LDDNHFFDGYFTNFVSSLLEYPRSQPELTSLDGGKARHRDEASAGELGKATPLGQHGQMRVGIIEDGDRFSGHVVVCPDLQSQRPLPHRRPKARRFKERCHAITEA